MMFAKDLSDPAPNQWTLCSPGQELLPELEMTEHWRVTESPG